MVWTTRKIPLIILKNLLQTLLPSFLVRIVTANIILALTIMYHQYAKMNVIRTITNGSRGSLPRFVRRAPHCAPPPRYRGHRHPDGHSLRIRWKSCMRAGLFVQYMSVVRCERTSARRMPMTPMWKSRPQETKKGQAQRQSCQAVKKSVVVKTPKLVSTQAGYPSTQAARRGRSASWMSLRQCSERAMARCRHPRRNRTSRRGCQGWRFATRRRIWRFGRRLQLRTGRSSDGQEPSFCVCVLSSINKVQKL